MTALVDAHCHLHESSQWQQVLTENTNIQKMLVMGSSPEDWDRVHAMQQIFPNRIIACYGLHPWYAHHIQAHDTAWLSDLRRRLTADPSSIAGEFGIDRVATVPPSDNEALAHWTGKNTFETHQRMQFEQQMQLAIELKRPVSLHCVQAQGFLLEFFRQKANTLPSMRQLKSWPKQERKEAIDALCPPAVMLHSYTGSIETLTQLTKLRGIGDRFFFSFSYTINRRMEEEKLKELIGSVPEDRLLVESDLGECMPDEYRESLNEIMKRVALARQWTFIDVPERMQRNMAAFLNLGGAKECLGGESEPSL